MENKLFLFVSISKPIRISVLGISQINELTLVVSAQAFNKYFARDWTDEIQVLGWPTPTYIFDLHCMKRGFKLCV